ncbi:MAG: hypothetical protein H6523_01730 [Mycolicibacterium sp.]|nr:hypothetical protein [Mycolicibacterium sp.]
MTDRFAQLTYTSFDTPGSAGGWQVKQTTGSITPAEQHVLVTGVHTTLNPVEPLPQYPTPEQIAALPRRLGYRPIDAGAAYWHTVPAGPDSTGRPGNVFAHVLLDRMPVPSAVRPIERWGSPGWLTPYGPTAVREAELGDRIPEMTALVSTQAVVDFACDATVWRLGTACVLLDAVLAAMRSNSSVVLGVSSLEHAALWIGLVSRFMSTGTAAALSFSTFDRPDELTVGNTEFLIAVPESDLDACAERGFFVLGESEPVSLGALGGQPHRTARGQQVPVTEWSAMAQVALIDPTDATVMFDQIDDAASRLDDTGLHPALPMALTVLAREEFADAVPEARSVVAEWAPPGLAVQPEVVALVEGEVVRRAGTTTEQAGRAAAAATGVLATALTGVYLTRACSDPAWLDRPGTLPLPQTGLSVEALGEPVCTDLVARLTALRGAGPIRLLRAADLLTAAGLGALAEPLLSSDIAPALANPNVGPDLIARLPGPVSPQLRGALAARLVGSQEAANNALRGLHPRLVSWLVEGQPRPTVTAAAAAEPGAAGWTATVLHAVRAVQSGSADPGDRKLAYWWLRRLGTGPDRLTPIAGTEGWTIAELLAAGGTTGPFPDRAAARALAAGAGDADTTELATRVIAAVPGDESVAVAAVWALSPADWVALNYLDSHFAAYVPFWDDVADLAPGAVNRAFLRRVLVLSVLGATVGARPPRLLAGAPIDDTLIAEAIGQVDTLLSDGVIDPATLLAAAALSADSGLPSPGVGPVLAAVAPRWAGRVDPGAVAEAAARLAGPDGEGRRVNRMLKKQLSGWQAESANPVPAHPVPAPTQWSQ